jgi:hypothetical protein
VPTGISDINPGDWVTANKQLAKDYAGTGDIISMKVKAKDLLTDPSSGEGGYTEEMLYRPSGSGDAIGSNPNSNDNESDPDFDSVEFDEESDSDFDDIDISDFIAKVTNASIPTPRPEPTPVTTPKPAVTGSLRKKASEFAKKTGLSVGRGKAPQLVIDVDNIQPAYVIGSPDVKAYAPSTQATAVKDEMVAMGRELVDQVSDETFAEFVANGTIDGSFDNLSDALAQYTEMNNKANLDLSKLQQAMTPMIDELRNSALENATPEDIKNLAKEIIKTLELSQYSEEEMVDFINNNGSLSLTDMQTHNYQWGTEKLSDEQLAENKLRNFKLKYLREKIESFVDEKTFDTPVGLYDLANYSWMLKNVELNFREVAQIMALRNDPEKIAKIQENADKMVSTGDFRDKMDPLSLSKKINQSIRDKAIRILKKNGFEFDSVKLSDFGDRLIKPGYGKTPISDSSVFGKRILEAFQYIPKSVLLASIDALNANNRRLTIRETKPGVRAHFQDLDLLIRGHSADDLLHEFWHFIQSQNKNIRALEHAWLYGRMVNSDGSLPQLMATGASSKEKAFAVDGLNDSYISKQYPDFRSGRAFFHPKNAFTEVSTTLMQDLFTLPGRYTRPTKRRAVTGNRRSKEIHNNAYFDEATNTWYADSTKTRKIQPHTIYGRNTQQGIDYDFKAFGFGLIMALHDWEA